MENANSSYCRRGRLTQCCQTLAQHFQLTDAKCCVRTRMKKILIFISKSLQHACVINPFYCTLDSGMQNQGIAPAVDSNSITPPQINIT